MLNFQNNSTHRVASRSLVVAGVIAISILAFVKPLNCQTTDEDAPERKLVTKVAPEYPETLKRLFIGGVVRVEIAVNANGAVESTQLLGGNPILGQSAMKAIKKWKYVPAATKTKFVVKVVFDPHNN